MFETKSPLSSVGIMGPAITILVWGLNQAWPGLGLGVPEVSDLVDQFGVLAAGVLGIFGRWKATKQISLTGS